VIRISLCHLHRPGVDPGIQLGGAMANVLREPIMGIWEQSPQRGPGAEPLVRISGGRDPWKLKDIHFFDALMRTKFGLFGLFLLVLTN